MSNMTEPRTVISRQSFDAVIFDLDGVVTDTASVHAAAWKQLFDEYRQDRLDRNLSAFDPFDEETDYREYVDGKPRYAGIESFLRARDIELPAGQPDDAEDKETLCGLANKKNALFHQRLNREGVQVYDSSVDLIRDLRSKGFKVAVVTASKNCSAVLTAAKIQDLFDAQVDGLEAEKLDLKGKPAPDAFLEAAKRLEIEPARAVIVEDARAGVQAGRDGAFGLVIGVDRTGDPRGLAEHGADKVVSDLAEVMAEGGPGPSTRPAEELPAALDEIDRIVATQAKQPAVFLDYDGTLTPIVAHAKDANLSEAMRAKLRSLAEICPVAVISGRDLADVRRRVGLEEIIYAGSHGFDIAGPNGMRRENPEAQDCLPALDQAEVQLRRLLGDIDGAEVERKKYAIAVHFRNVDDADVPTIEEAVDKAISEQVSLRKRQGKKIFELQPDIDWDKGRAVLWLLHELDLDQSTVLPLYVGDDVTDEDAFRALSGRGLGIVVRDELRQTAAQYALETPEEVGTFLDLLVTRTESMNKWTLVYDGYDPKQEGLREALCTLGNGCFATRGAAPESVADGVHYPGTYLAGGYNRLQTKIAGHVVENEDLVNLPNWLVLSFRVENGEWLDLQKVEILSYRQELNLRHGVLTRIVRFRDAEDRCTTLTQRRIVSMANPHLAALETTWQAENWSGRIEVCSALDGRVINDGVARYRSLNGKHLVPVETDTPAEDSIYLKVRTSQSQVNIAQAARMRWFGDGERIEPVVETFEEPGYIAQHFMVELTRGQTVIAEKIVTLFTSWDRAISECGLAAREALEKSEGFAGIMRHHARAWRHLWERFDMKLEFNPRVEPNHIHLILHLHIFHLLQTASPHTIDLDVGVPSRGWHGEAYRGHIFWDELFIFPMLNLRIPDVTRSLLKYRYRRLEMSRQAARAANYSGAMYPWQSGSDGREESQVVHLNPKSGRWLPDNSHLQRHINAAIVYNIWQYYQISDDREFLYFQGIEIILEIARFWSSIATYNEKLERYEILGVMGPDEYHDAYPGAETPGLNNNAYTNLMAVWVLCRALELRDVIPDEHYTRVVQKLDVKEEEIQRWQDISRKMRLVFHDDGDILSQFEGYADLREFDWETYREKHGLVMRLDRILEAEDDTPNRYKASKQADVLMLFYLFSEEELKQLFTRLGYAFDPQMIPRNIDYYLNRTSNGSTLSSVVNSWVVARSDRARSWHLFTEALRSDVSDVQGGTTPEGIHLGAMAATVDVIQRCYTGIEARGDVLRVNPQLPDELARLRLRIRYQEASICLELTHQVLKARVVHCPVEPIRIGFQEAVMELKEGEEIEINLATGKSSKIAITP